MKDTVTKNKKTLFSLKPLYPFFSIFQLFPAVSSSTLYEPTLTISYNLQDMCTSTTNVTQNNKTPYSFSSYFSHVHFLFYHIFTKQIIIFWLSLYSYYMICIKQYSHTTIIIEHGMANLSHAEWYHTNNAKEEKRFHRDFTELKHSNHQPLEWEERRMWHL